MIMPFKLFDRHVDMSSIERAGPCAGRGVHFVVFQGQLPNI